MRKATRGGIWGGLGKEGGGGYGHRQYTTGFVKDSSDEVCSFKGYEKEKSYGKTHDISSQNSRQFLHSLPTKRLSKSKPAGKRMGSRLEP
jgi:hypothetical protein